MAAMGAAVTVFLAGTAAAQPLSPAQAALFDTPHLSNIVRPETLDYSFEQEGADGFTDSVKEHIEAVRADGTKSIAVDFLSGARRLQFSRDTGFAGNPLIMLFLEHDVHQLGNRLGVSSAYLRNRLRQAFLDSAVVAPTTIDLDGRTVAARRITVRPFADDPALAPSGVQDVAYSFVLADAVPGMVEELGSTVPADPSRGRPAFGERIRYVGENP